jgi:uncharacterized membrane protein YecN with MAPEG domain
MQSPILLTVTLITASVLGLIYMVLMLRVVRLRLGKRVSMGDGGNAELQARIRAHGNFAEYVPLLLVLMALLELGGVDRAWLAVSGVVLVLVRVAHAVGMHRPAPNAFRFVGAVGTFVLMIVFCGYGLWLGFAA